MLLSREILFLRAAFAQSSKLATTVLLSKSICALQHIRTMDGEGLAQRNGQIGSGWGRVNGFYVRVRPSAVNRVEALALKRGKSVSYW
jgi:hypothetical protein